MAVTGHALNQLLQQMDRTFSNVTGQSVSFIDQEGHYQGPLRLDVFTGFCRRVISSEKGAQHCLACNHSFGLDAEQRCTVSQCHMGISVISVPVPLPEARGLSLTYGQFLTRDTEGAFYSTLRRHCQELELDYDEMVALAGTLRVLSAEELDARMQMLQVFAGYVATSEVELETRREYARQVEKKLALERALHASEFKFLQSQISPHFLFNTLNLLMRTAYREGAPQTADLICDLADLLRRAYYYKDSICTLAEEMQCARQYLTLQSQRLGPGFSFEVGDVSACGQLMIPVLTIQPLVENAILHGAGEDEYPLHVKVSATAEDGKLVISVSDNGAGIPEEVLKKLRDHLSGGGLGGGFTLLGDGAVLLAALANGFSISLFKRYAEGEDTLTLCGYQFIVGGGLLLLTGLCFGGTLPHFTGQSLLLLGYMVLLSAVAQTIWSALTRYNPVGRVAVYGFLNPVFGVLLSALLLREGQPVQFSGIGTGMRGNFCSQPQRCPRQGSAGRSATITGKGTVPTDRLFCCGRDCYIRLHIFGYSASGTAGAPPRRCQRYPPTPLGDGEGFQIPAADQCRPAEEGL